MMIIYIMELLYLDKYVLPHIVTILTLILYHFTNILIGPASANHNSTFFFSVRSTLLDFTHEWIM
jgi:hypothetical protein